MCFTVPVFTIPLAAVTLFTLFITHAGQDSACRIAGAAPSACAADACRHVGFVIESVDAALRFVHIPFVNELTEVWFIKWGPPDEQQGFADRVRIVMYVLIRDM